MGSTKEILMRSSLQDWVRRNICTLERMEQHLRISLENWRSMIPAQIFPGRRYVLAP